MNLFTVNRYYIKPTRRFSIAISQQKELCSLADTLLFAIIYCCRCISAFFIASILHFYKYQIFSVSNDQVNFSAFTAKILCYNKKALFFQKGSRLFFMAAAMVIAFVVSMYSIQFLLGYVKKHDFKFFGYYRIVLGVIVLIYFGLTAILTK